MMGRRRVLFPFTGTLIGGSVVSGSLIAKSLAESPDWEVKVAIPIEGPTSAMFRDAGLRPDIYGLSDKTMNRIRFSTGYAGKLKAVLAYRTAIRVASRYLREHKPDIVHINDDRSVMVWGIAAKLNRIPVVWHIRQEKGNKLLDKWRLSLAQSIIFVAEANRVRFRGNDRLPPNETIHNGVDLSRFGPGDKAASKRALGLSPDREVVGFIGNLLARKRPEWFVEAAIASLRQGADAEFVLVGEDMSGGPYLQRLQALARKAGYADRIHFLGFRKDIPAILQAFDVLALTSEPQGEAFPRVIIEAMATGIPVVATNVAGVPEAVADGETGFLADPADAADLQAKLLRLLRDGELRGRMAAAAQEAALRKFSADEVARRVKGIYHDITGDYRKDGRLASDAVKGQG